jgi:hypothetical protein
VFHEGEKHNFSFLNGLDEWFQNICLLLVYGSCLMVKSHPVSHSACSCPNKLYVVCIASSSSSSSSSSNKDVRKN